MRIDVRADQKVAAAFVREYAQRRVRAALERFGRDVTAVSVDIGDTNGPKGGVDKHCRISVRVAGQGDVFGESSASGVDAAVDGAAGRIERAVTRAISRARARTSETVRKSEE